MMMIAVGRVVVVVVVDNHREMIERLETGTVGKRIEFMKLMK